jgi:hypothetical protein
MSKSHPCNIHTHLKIFNKHLQLTASDITEYGIRNTYNLTQARSLLSIVDDFNYHIDLVDDKMYEYKKNKYISIVSCIPLILGIIILSRTYEQKMPLLCHTKSICSFLSVIWMFYVMHHVSYDDAVYYNAQNTIKNIYSRIQALKKSVHKHIALYKKTYHTY